ncbi:MAG: nuclear receptor-binding factor 2 [Bacteroidales bacterium]|nr:nuclear receptor-binding factor 2 [Bacteroidales bacterium]
MVFTYSCASPGPGKPGTPAEYFSLVQSNDSLYYIRIESDSAPSMQWELPYPVYRFQTGDIDRDGSVDVLVGVIKATRFDPIPRKRVFIFKDCEGAVRPLWLGSQLGIPLEDFRFYQTRGEPCVRIIGRENNGKYLVAEYTWQKFGLKFKKYILRHISLKTANNLLILN